MRIFCTGCGEEVEALLVNGAVIYPHRKDLKELPFWQCGTCKSYVGCHHKTKDREKPKGVLATAEMRTARKHIHALLDPLWKGSSIDRKEIYRRISEKIGYKYHTAELRSIEEARRAYKIIQAIAKTIKK